MRAIALSLFLLLPLCASAVTEEASYAKFASSVPPGECVTRVRGLSEFKLLFGIESFRESVHKGVISPAVSEALASWSTDLIVQTVIQVERDYLAVCKSSAFIESTLDTLRKAYLGRLGAPVFQKPLDNLSAFRGLLAVKEDTEALSKKLKLLPPGLPVAGLLRAMYANADLIEGVWVLGASPSNLKALRTISTRVCGKRKACHFWDSRYLYKVMVLSQPGLAAFLPEMGVLILSEDLLESANTLNSIVVAHELAHVAELRAWHLVREKWSEEFLQFSGWRKNSQGHWELKVIELASERQDALTKESKDSPYSILPDPVLGVESADGFAMAKAYRASLERQDPSEDLADHVAVFLIMPERYCWKKKNLARAKYQWVGQKLGMRGRPLSCP